jgi:hypothetical protein
MENIKFTEQELAKQAGLIITRNNPDEELEFLGTIDEFKKFEQLKKDNNL